MADVLVPQAPPLARIPNVELMHPGTWPLSNGVFTFTTEDLYQACAALACPAVRRPILKLGHVDPRFDGEPAVGYIDNLAVVDGGYTLVGDYAGIPGWLADIAASAYPDRSIEGTYDFQCQMGHTHPFVLTAVAFLGVAAPGIGSLESLQDVAQLFGVQVAASMREQGWQEKSPASGPLWHGPRQQTSTAGTPVVVPIHASQEGGAMPNPNPRKVAASVTSDDVSRAFYASPLGQNWDAWITEVQVDPVQVIYCDDSTGDTYRVPVTIGDGDGADAVTFADPIRVVMRYDDAGQVAAAAPGREPIRYASRAESRPGVRPAAADVGSTATCVDCGHLGSSHNDINAGANSGRCLMANCDCSAMTTAAAAAPTPPAEPAEGTTPTPTPEDIVADAPSTLREGLLTRLGVTDADADESTLLAALDEALTERAVPDPQPVLPAVPQLPDGVTVIDTAALEELQVAAAAGQEARRRQLTEDRDTAIRASVRDGRIPVARKAHWEAMWDKDPEGASQALASLAPGTVPVQAAGVAGGTETDPDEAAFKGLGLQQFRQEANV